MLICGRYLGVLAKVYSHATVEHDFAVQRLPDELCGFNIVEDNDDATERLQWRPCVNRGMLVYQASDRLEVIWLEDGGNVEILFVVRTESPRRTLWK
jgi:hypothetical protein